MIPVQSTKKKMYFLIVFGNLGNIGAIHVVAVNLPGGLLEQV